eukprot:scaffold5479_cov199-Amphora_coffeaeformis.AAC.7
MANKFPCRVSLISHILCPLRWFLDIWSQSPEAMSFPQQFAELSLLLGVNRVCCDRLVLGHDAHVILFVPCAHSMTEVRRRSAFTTRGCGMATAFDPSGLLFPNWLPQGVSVRNQTGKLSKGKPCCKSTAIIETVRSKRLYHPRSLIRVKAVTPRGGDTRRGIISTSNTVVIGSGKPYTSKVIRTRWEKVPGRHVFDIPGCQKLIYLLSLSMVTEDIQKWRLPHSAHWLSLKWVRLGSIVFVDDPYFENMDQGSENRVVEVVATAAAAAAAVVLASWQTNVSSLPYSSPKRGHDRIERRKPEERPPDKGLVGLYFKVEFLVSTRRSGERIGKGWYKIPYFVPRCKPFGTHKKQTCTRGTVKNRHLVSSLLPTMMNDRTAPQLGIDNTLHSVNKQHDELETNQESCLPDIVFGLVDLCTRTVHTESDPATNPVVVHFDGHVCRVLLGVDTETQQWRTAGALAP